MTLWLTISACRRTSQGAGGLQPHWLAQIHYFSGKS